MTMGGEDEPFYVMCGGDHGIALTFERAVAMLYAVFQTAFVDDRQADEQIRLDDNVVQVVRYIQLRRFGELAAAKRDFLYGLSPPADGDSPLPARRGVIEMAGLAEEMLSVVLWPFIDREPPEDTAGLDEYRDMMMDLER
ncbi:unnamed protein product [Vitrella brassicaformis CCMP3155]|uniref:Uncharacterized protein n=1 Tax=Vitrella brassicaformis (strain CCMP3155) TaxID=1169540 RepID=A0A0G4GCQ5_VITBC|nr:unnamed protein product [Vitrella brassicaformis CCMP3155]|mmetsp:Transcript_7014/g.20321  ORF Transcript_7014/g.20321 Transcript_7014/m.20321 type:complete len:140 (+) Transcript_7014:273-692(+)|eukprot:CEM26582.1 unnamed protein product [Vitrella brassicaformis CCMP3155]